MIEQGKRFLELRHLYSAFDATFSCMMEIKCKRPKRKNGQRVPYQNSLGRFSRLFSLGRDCVCLTDNY